MATENPVWKMVERIERAFSKDDIHSAPRKVLEDVLSATYEDLCGLADSQVEPWEMDEVALAQVRSRILSTRS